MNVEDFVSFGKASATAEASMEEQNPVGRLTIVDNRKIQHNLIALAAPTTSAIVDWLAVRGNCQPSEPLFVSLDRRSTRHRLDGSSIYRLVRKFSEAAGIDTIVSPHQVRHSAITAYLNASEGNVRGAQGLSRHTSLNILTRYEDNRQKYQEQASNILADLV